MSINSLNKKIFWIRGIAFFIVTVLLCQNILLAGNDNNYNQYLAVNSFGDTDPRNSGAVEEFRQEYDRRANGGVKVFRGNKLGIRE